MAITAQLVKELRERTGAGMMDCKKALVENDGDMEKAIEFLQKKGMAAAAKKAGRVAAEGLIHIWTNDDDTEAVIVEVNSETDFVARNDQFAEFVSTITEAIAGSNAKTVEDVAALTVGGRTVADLTTESIATIGENIGLRRFERMVEKEGTIGAYIHAGSQIGVAVQLKGSHADLQETARDIAMHVAAMNPQYLSPGDIDESDAAKQEEIFTAQLKDEGKPEQIIPKILIGKMTKWREAGSLLTQAFVKNPDITVAQLVEGLGNAQLVGFIRYQVGEGIEKVESNLADEVAAQLQG